MTKRKRVADWLEKISAAFMAGSVLTEKDFFLAFFSSLICLAISIWLTKTGD